ncbi:TlpA disulfide reductase family protein [Ningiella sp. W23]|uniref:TlpA disulfide reductase family protein n=1 Tax=Ningiella sp. W23 TaxID=3023715 RepID=UPI0037566FA3
MKRVLRSAKITLITTLTLISLSTFAQNEATKPEQTAQDAAEQRVLAPNWTLENADGEMVSFSDFKGKPTIIHFWGTWCSFCKRLHPGLEKIRAEYESQGLQIVGISINEPIGAKPAQVLKDRGINFPTLLDGDDVALQDFEIYGTPTTIFISAKGEILGATMESNPDDPRFEKIAQYLVQTQ